jgi:hypothetical protein
MREFAAFPTTQAELRACVFEAIDEQHVKAGGGGMGVGQSERFMQLQSTQEGRLTTHLVLEFLEWAGLDYSRKVYAAEAAAEESYEGRAALGDMLGLNDAGDMPLLLAALSAVGSDQPPPDAPGEAAPADNHVQPLELEDAGEEDELDVDAALAEVQQPGVSVDSAPPASRLSSNKQVSTPLEGAARVVDEWESACARNSRWMSQQRQCRQWSDAGGTAHGPLREVGSVGGIAELCVTVVKPGEFVTRAAARDGGTGTAARLTPSYKGARSRQTTCNRREGRSRRTRTLLPSQCLRTRGKSRTYPIRRDRRRWVVCACVWGGVRRRRQPEALAPLPALKPKLAPLGSSGALPPLRGSGLTLTPLDAAPAELPKKAPVPLEDDALHGSTEDMNRSLELGRSADLSEHYSGDFSGEVEELIEEESIEEVEFEAPEMKDHGASYDDTYDDEQPTNTSSAGRNISMDLMASGLSASDRSGELDLDDSADLIENAEAQG